MTSKQLTTPLTNALSEGDLDLIRQATTDDELEIMKTRLKIAKSQGTDFYNLRLGKLPMALYLLKEKRLQSLKILADLGLNLHVADTYNSNALHYSVQKSNEYVSFLIQQGVSIHHRNKNGIQPLAFACGHILAANPDTEVNSRLQNIESLLKAGANINDRNPSEEYHKGRTALTWAIITSRSSLKILDFLMQRQELEIHNVNGEGDSALHIAAALGNIAVIQYLINAHKDRLNLDQVNNEGLTALEVAKRDGSEEVKEYLTDLYGALAEQKELDAITSRTTNNMAAAENMENAKGVANGANVAEGVNSETAGVAEGILSDGHPSDLNPSRATGSLTQRPNSRLSSKPRSL